MSEARVSPAGWAARALLVVGGVACLFPFTAAWMGLLGGILLSLTLGNPWIEASKKWTPRLLQASVVGLGAGMDLLVVLRVGAHGILYTVAGITLAFAAGVLLARTLSVSRDVGTLVAVGTAICGGSAIAAVAPVIRAKDDEVSVAMGTVFLLNSIALLIFPPLGHLLGLDAHGFGLWAALAIHDTSSVVGAARQYGDEALRIATTVKLARALWIVPVALAIGAVRARREQGADAVAAGKAKRPWFIAGFLAAAALATFVPGMKAPGEVAFAVSRQFLVLTLFLIGANLSRAAIARVGVRPLAMGVALWVIVGGASLAGVLTGVVH